MVEDSWKWTTWSIAVVIAGSVLWPVWTIYRRYLESKVPVQGIPMLPDSHWLFGHARLVRRLAKNPISFTQGSRVNGHGQVGLWIGPRRFIILTHFEDVRSVLAAEYHRTAPPLISSHIYRFLGPNNIGLLHGRRWKTHRAAIYKAVSPPSVLVEAQQAVHHVTTTLCQSLRRRLNQKEKADAKINLDVEELMKMFTIDVYALASLSTDLSCCERLAPSPIATAFGELMVDLNNRMGNLFNPFYLLYWIPTEENQRHYRNTKRLREYLAGLIQERIENRTQAKDHDRVRYNASKEANVSPAVTTSKRDILNNLMDVHSEVGDDFLSQKTLSDVLMTLLVAGFDTTSITLTYTFYLVSQNPRVEQRCLEEIRSVLALIDKSNENHNSGEDYEKLDPANLVYCNAVVMEALRLYPPAGATTRVLQKPLKIKGGITLPRGTDIFIPIDYIHRLERHFERPLEFLPERWIEKIESTRNKAGMWKERVACNQDAFFAFSGGGRSCPGQRFAMQEALIVFARLLLEFRFEATPGHQVVPERQALVQHPRGGMPMTISVR